MDVERICAEYLRSVSPMAQRIAEDIDSVRFAYKDLWKTLDSKDKNQVLDEALIDPAAVVKYANKNKENNINLEPLSNFSWFTQSQLNLFTHYLPTQLVNQVVAKSMRTPIKCSDLTPQKRSLTVTAASPQLQHHHHSSSSSSASLRSPQAAVSNNGGRRQSTKSNVAVQDTQSPPDIPPPVTVKGSTTILAKPRNPPPPPPALSTTKSETKALLLDLEENIPKTGFDFLDNW